MRGQLSECVHLMLASVENERIPNTIDKVCNGVSSPPAPRQHVNGFPNLLKRPLAPVPCIVNKIYPQSYFQLDLKYTNKPNFFQPDALSQMQKVKHSIRFEDPAIL